jgi:hypothetical protein
VRPAAAIFVNKSVSLIVAHAAGVIDTGML